MRNMTGIVSKKYNFPASLPAIIVLSCIAYGAGINNGFVWDDETFIVNNPFVHDLGLWPEYFTRAEAISNVQALSRLYRPLQTLSYALDAAVWHSWGGGYHLTSLLLHIASSFAIIFAFGNLLGRRAAVIAALIFSVHPALSESVLSLAARGNQLYTLFALVAIGYFTRITRPFDRSHLVSALAVLLSLFSKEPAVAVVALLPIIQVFFERPWKLLSRTSVLLLAPFLVITGLYLAARMAVVDTAPLVPYWGGTPVNTLLMQSKVFVLYLRLLVWPFILSARYPISYPDGLSIIYVLINVAFIVMALVAYRRSAAGRLLAFAVVWFYGSLAPVSNLIPIPGNMMGERFLYFTFAGMLPLLIAAAQNVLSRRHSYFALCVMAVVLSAYLITDIKRTSVWKDNAVFFAVLTEQQPDEPVAQIWMAKEEIAAGKAASAADRLGRIIGGLSTHTPEEKAPAFYWYGRALLAADRPQEAFRQFAVVVLLQRNLSADLVPFLVEASARSGNLAKVRTLLEKELQASPENDLLWNNLGNVLMMAGDVAGGRSAYTRALKINPANSEAATNLSNARNAVNESPR